MPISLSSIRNASLMIAWFFSSIAAACEVRMPLLFSDHMVLQRDLPMRVWGWADPGESVTVSFGKDLARTIAGSEGRWNVTLRSIPANSHPQTLVITGKNTLEFHDVLVGDVWVCSGQSNMERLLREVDYTDADLRSADDGQLRLFRVLSTTAVTPQEDTKGWNGRQWMVSKPVDVKDFSAVGFFFGRELRKHLGIPIALVDSTQGGSRAQLWTSVDSLEKHIDADPEFGSWIGQRNELLKTYPQRMIDYPEAKKSYDEKLRQWNSANDANPEYTAEMAAWQTALNKARKEGAEHPAKVIPPILAPIAPDPPDGGPYSTFMVGNLYNSMIAPLTSFSIKGVLWYQGEANDRNAKQYQVLFPILISDWRDKWGQGDFPFLFVQLPNLGAPATEPVRAEDRWAKLREAQSKALALRNTGMVATIDIGDPWDVHGRDKSDIGIRLSLLARHTIYREKVVPSGPSYRSMKINGRKVEVRFANHGRGLMIGVPPWTPTGKIPPVSTELHGFAIAGGDRKWFWANAAIHGNRVTVWSDKVTAPAAVRYGWADNPPCNLYNREGLPAPPFRTDDWPL